MPYGSPWSEQFVRQLADKEVRSEFVADQVRARISQLIRCLREQSDRNWTQAELGERAGKPQNVISRFEDPNYGKMSLQSLFDLAAAFDLPVWIDMPEWEDWLAHIKHIPDQTTHRSSFDLAKLVEHANDSSDEFSVAPLSGGAALAAAAAVRNMVLGPAQMPQILGTSLNANALPAASNKLPLEQTDSAMSNAVIARTVAA